MQLKEIRVAKREVRSRRVVCPCDQAHKLPTQVVQEVAERLPFWMALDRTNIFYLQ